MIAMTTRAGWAGIICGLLSTVITYLFFAFSPELFLQVQQAVFFTRIVRFFILVMAVVIMGSGWLAARWSKSTQPGRCTILGALAGALAGSIVFCLWGSAVAGEALLSTPDQYAMIGGVPPVEVILTEVRQTLGMFLMLFLGGSFFGGLGGRLSRIRKQNHTDRFNREDPQMAMNVSITALPASILAAALAAYMSSKIAGLDIGTSINRLDANLPLEVSLLLVLISHLALTQVVPHETRQAEHFCGMNEVMMAAFVSIAAAPVLFLLLLLIKPDSLLNPVIAIALLASLGMSISSLVILVKQVLPRRASMPVPCGERQKTEARWFGSIADSYGSRLVKLCIGCGLAMVLPLYACVVSVLINLNSGYPNTTPLPPVSEEARRHFLTQILTSTGLVVGAIVTLILIYLFYLNLGRRFSRKNSQHSGE